MERDWKLELSSKEGIICIDLSLKLNPNNQINLTEKEMYEYCGYKSMRYFRKHLNGLIEKGIVIKNDKFEDKPYFFNPIYVEYDEIGPKLYHRPLGPTDEEYYSQARELILEMKANFIPYVEVLIEFGVEDSEEKIILFGKYLSKAKQNANGEKMISKGSFEKFVAALKK